MAEGRGIGSDDGRTLPHGGGRGAERSEAEGEWRRGEGRGRGLRRALPLPRPQPQRDPDRSEPARRALAVAVAAAVAVAPPPTQRSHLNRAGAPGGAGTVAPSARLRSRRDLPHGGGGGGPARRAGSEGARALLGARACGAVPIGFGIPLRLACGSAPPPRRGGGPAPSAPQPCRGGSTAGTVAPSARLRLAPPPSHPSRVVRAGAGPLRALLPPPLGSASRLPHRNGGGRETGVSLLPASAPPPIPMGVGGGEGHDASTAPRPTRDQRCGACVLLVADCRLPVAGCGERSEPSPTSPAGRRRSAPSHPPRATPPPGDATRSSPSPGRGRAAASAPGPRGAAPGPAPRRGRPRSP